MGSVQGGDMRRKGKTLQSQIDPGSEFQKKKRTADRVAKREPLRGGKRSSFGKNDKREGRGTGGQIKRVGSSLSEGRSADFEAQLKPK